MDRQALVWVKESSLGAEFAAVRLSTGRLFATGVAVGGGPLPYRLEYGLDTGSGFVTKRLQVRASGAGWSRQLVLVRAPEGSWSVGASDRGAVDLPPPGGDTAPLDGALDCDLGLSPLTNTMPVLREGMLTRDGSADFLMAWVSVPDLAVHLDRQRYTHLSREPDGGALVRFENDEGFRADIRFDALGFVLDYPGLARRI